MSNSSFPEAFRTAMSSLGLSPGGQRLLLAVSGGLDSVVLAESCWLAGYDFAVAHAQFGLRGEESADDEAFVRGMAARFGRPFFCETFDAKKYGRENGLSLQAAARVLRYAWFDRLREAPGAPFAFLLTGHHLDDNIETALMHFFRGTGISGLRGMLPRQGNIVRPLLAFPRERLATYAAAAGIAWREDSSNQGDAYTRNYFRHHLIPSVAAVFPGVTAALEENLQRFRDTEIIFKEAMEKKLQKLLRPVGGEFHISVLLLKKSIPPDAFLFAIGQRFGFPASVVPELRRLLDADTGKYVSGPTHRIIRNRAWLIVAPHAAPDPGFILIERAVGATPFPEGKLVFTPMPVAPPATENADRQIAVLDARDIRFPLVLRRAKPGDYFYPLGMVRKKKIARFLVDSKLSKTAKEKVWVLEMDRKILWVIGLRIDNRFRLLPSTRECLKIELRVL